MYITFVFHLQFLFYTINKIKRKEKAKCTIRLLLSFLSISFIYLFQNIISLVTLTLLFPPIRHGYTSPPPPSSSPLRLLRSKRHKRPYTLPHPDRHTRKPRRKLDWPRRLFLLMARRLLLTLLSPRHWALSPFPLLKRTTNLSLLLRPAPPPRPPRQQTKRHRFAPHELYQPRTRLPRR